MIEAIGLGVAFGLAAGVAPGPLLAMTVSTTLSAGRRAGAGVALVPLITDAPIIIAAIVAADRVSSTALGMVGLVGAVFVVWLGIEQMRSAARPPTVAAMSSALVRQSVMRGVIANVLSPHPYVFWVTVGVPVLARLNGSGGVRATVLFIATFSALLVGTKLAVAGFVDTSRQWMSGRAYRITLQVTGSRAGRFRRRPRSGFRCSIDRRLA